MLGHIALIILLWFLISIVVALALGVVFARKDRYSVQSPGAARVEEIAPEKLKQQPAKVEQLARSD
jgi:hypothetical protein